MPENTQTFPVVVSPMSPSLAGKSLFCMSGMLHGEDTDTVHTFWSTDLAAATAQFRRLLLADAGFDDEAIDHIIQKYTSNRPWGHISSQSIVATMNAEGTEVTFAQDLTA